MSLLKRLEGGKPIQLKAFDPDAHGGFQREEAEKRTQKLGEELSELQTLLYAAQQTPVLIVLQGMDAAGKDGTVRHVMSFLNPQSCRVVAFKVPTPVETAHDFLWRVHAETPGRGTVMIFNRSHYEDVLVVRVHRLVPPEVWERRYDHILHFERLLADNDTILLKFFLHIDEDEQKRRLLSREKDPTKSWKITPADWKEREFWDDYQAAYEDALNRCATPFAPWYIVPANRKWFRNLAIAETLVETLRPLKEGWIRQLKARGKEEMQELRAMRSTH